MLRQNMSRYCNEYSNVIDTDEAATLQIHVFVRLKYYSTKHNSVSFNKNKNCITVGIKAGDIKT